VPGETFYFPFRGFFPPNINASGNAGAQEIYTHNGRTFYDARATWAAQPGSWILTQNGAVPVTSAGHADISTGGILVRPQGASSPGSERILYVCFDVRQLKQMIESKLPAGWYDWTATSIQMMPYFSTDRGSGTLAAGYNSVFVGTWYGEISNETSSNRGNILSAGTTGGSTAGVSTVRTWYQPAVNWNFPLDSTLGDSSLQNIILRVSAWRQQATGTNGWVEVIFPTGSDITDNPTASVFRNQIKIEVNASISRLKATDNRNPNLAAGQLITPGKLYQGVNQVKRVIHGGEVVYKVPNYPMP